MALAQPRFQGSLLTVPISLAQQGRVGENPGNEVVSLLSRTSAKMPLSPRLAHKAPAKRANSTRNTNFSLRVWPHGHSLRKESLR